MPDGGNAVITGANRGLGLAAALALAARGLHVVMCVRRPASAADALRRVRELGGSAELQQVDVRSAEDCARLSVALDRPVDILINNAGILRADADADPLDAAPSALAETFDVNALGAVRMIQALAPRLVRGARIVNVSSGMGALTGMGGGNLGYRMSKTALNAVTRVFSQELAPRGILVNSVCPGWVRTDMGGPGAPRSLERGIDTIVWLATAPEATGTGGFYRDRRPIAW